MIGTLSGTHTTPGGARAAGAASPTLRRRGDRAVVMEVSSHALALHRVDGTRFAAAVFTNLGTDHLDLHGTVEEYFRAKARLFTPELAAVGVTNVDDAHGRLLLDAAPIAMVPYSLADVDRRRGHAPTATPSRGAGGGVAVGARRRRSTSPTRSPRRRRPTCSASTLDAIVAGLAAADAVPGRFERDRGRGGSRLVVIVDYAHTPDGLEQVLAAARGVAAGPGDRRVRLRRRPRPRQAAADGRRRGAGSPTGSS